MDIKVQVGDIVEVEADAVITAVNSLGVWFENGMNGALKRVGGDMFHDQLADALVENPDLAVFATERGLPHIGMFDAVIFVIDNVGFEPNAYEMLSVVVRRGLVYASDHGFKRVTMPLIRFGSRRDVGGSVLEKLDDIARAVDNQRMDIYNDIQELTIVVADDAAFAAILCEKLGLD